MDLRLSRFFTLLTTAAIMGFSSPSTAAQNGNDFSLGIEGFRDNYREPDPGVDVSINSNYGSLTAKYVHNWDAIFGAIDGRYSYGTDHYSSPSGTFSGAKQDEFEARVRTGLNLTFANGAVYPYIGAGIRYFIDNGKGEVTDLGAVGYDRRITQYYAPIGVTYSYFSGNGFSLSPNLEFDPLLYGNVNTRLQNVGGYNINNAQHTGYGLRGEIMAGWQSGYTEFQFGPFIRYWRISASDVAYDPTGTGWIEPRNTRTQYGLALRVLW